MIIDSCLYNDKNKHDADFVIVGGGLCGLFLSQILKESNKKIIIIEKGDEYLNLLNEKRSLNIGVKHNGSQNEEGFQVGGNSNLWGGQLSEFQEIDINKNFWGLSYNELKKLYKDTYKLFDIHTVDDPTFLNQDNIISNKNVKRFFNYFLKNPKIFDLYNKELKNSKNIKLLKNLTAYDLIFENEKATQINCLSRNGKKLFIKSKFYIFCLGAIENSRFFLSLKNSAKSSPIKNNRFIGNFFQDHIGITTGKIQIKLKKKFRNFFEYGFYKKIRYVPKLKNNSLNIGICAELITKSKFNNTLNDWNNLFKTKNIPDIKKLLMKTLNLPKKYIEQYFYQIINNRCKSFFDDGVNLFIQSEQIPLYESKITINKELLRDGLNKVNIDWNIHGDELREIKKFSYSINEFLKNNDIGNIDFSNNIDNFETFKNDLRDTNHPSGGLIISKDKENGVCDSNFKVWNTENVYINGSSLFPNSSYANVTLTVLALTLKIGRYLKKII